MVKEAITSSDRGSAADNYCSDNDDAAYPIDPGQDRYALRTAAQWNGPVLPFLALAHAHITTEINGVTDNPLLWPVSSGSADIEFVQGGNFQASPVAMAMDMVCSGLHSMGRLLFQQLMHLPTSRGLSPNLTAAADPNGDFLFKGAEVAAASYVSELAFLERRVGQCVQVAEQGNQSVNALALLSARLTSQALDVFEQLAATGVVGACQALDLRTVNATFAERFALSFMSETETRLHGWLPSDSARVATDAQFLARRLFSRFLYQVSHRAHQDIRRRFMGAMKNVATALQAAVPPEQRTRPKFAADLME